MNKNIKVPAVVGFILYAGAAFFSIAILTVFFDFCGLDSVHGTWIWQFGKLFTGVYGVCSALIPVFLLVAAFQCFMQSWRVRNGVVLAGSIIPFFTLDAIEHIFRMLIAENSGDSLIMKLMIAALTGGVIVAIEFLVLSILGDAIEGSSKKTKEEKPKENESFDALDDGFDIKSILNQDDDSEEILKQSDFKEAENKEEKTEQESETQKAEIVPEDNPFAHIFDEQDKIEESKNSEKEETDSKNETKTPENFDLEEIKNAETENNVNYEEKFALPKNADVNEDFEESEQFADSDEKTILSDEQAWNNWGAQNEDSQNSKVVDSVSEDEKSWENWKTDDENEELSDWNDEEKEPQENIENSSIDVSAEKEVLDDKEEVEEEDAEEEIAEDATLPEDNKIEAAAEETLSDVEDADDVNPDIEDADFAGTDGADADFTAADADAVNSEPEDEEIELPDLTDDFLNEEIEDFPENKDFEPNTDFDDFEDDFADENEDAIAQEAQENYEDFTADKEFAEEESVEADDKKLNEARDYFSDDETEESLDNGDDGFGDEESEDNLEGGDLSDFVEQRNSRFASIFAEMGRDAANSVKQANVSDAPVETEVTQTNFYDAPVEAEEDDFASTFAGNDDDSDEESQSEPDDTEETEKTNEADGFDSVDVADFTSSEELADTHPFDGYEFDPTAEPVVDSDGMPFKKKTVLAEPKPAQSATQVQTKVQPKLRIANYNVPVEGILQKYDNDEYWVVDAETKKKASDLMQTLAEFNIEVKVTGIRKGPVVTMFEVLPAPGVNVNKIRNLQDNIALRLAATSVRIVSPIPGKSAVGIEIPNKTRAIVSFREIIEQKNPAFDKMAIPVILGKDISGEPRIIDLAKTPHLLIAGSTGSGKSVCVNSLILSILYKRNPNLVKLILIDPKVVELKLYNDIPHLLTPVITEPKKALQSLQYCICEMERRYALLDNMGVRDILSYNRRIEERKLMQEKLPYIVIIIDEFADLMATTGKELESNVSRLAAMSRAVGIHLVLATQRPSVNVITGLIKANIPSRIAFMVASRTDSNIIIDQIGAEKLLGKGDMLYASATDPFPVRIQGTLVSDDEVEKVVEYVKQYGEPDYIDDEIFVEDEDENEGAPGLFSDGDDPLYDQALEIVVQSGKASASYLQRRLKIGYNRAARLVEEMEERGIVGPQNGSKPREVIYVP